MKRQGPSLPARQSPWSLVAILVLLVQVLLGASTARANGGSYATAGTGTYAQSLWWLDFTGFSYATSSAGGQAAMFYLPNGAGTLSTTVTSNGNTALAAVALPTWTLGGAFGNGAYNGITGSPSLFKGTTSPSAGVVSLTAITVKDAAGNARSFSLYAADGENTEQNETNTYTASSTWTLVDTVDYYAAFTGNIPTVTGTGTSTVTEAGYLSGETNYDSSFVFGTANPSQVSVTLTTTGGQAVLFAVSMPTVTLNLNIAGRASTSDQFTGTIGYTSPPVTVYSGTTSGTGTTYGSGAISVIGSNSVTLAASLAAGSSSALSYYSGAISCTNSGPGAGSYGGTNTVLPSGAGTSFALTPQTGDSITCTLTLTPVTQALSGTVYADTNHNATLDASETGTGITGLYVKLATLSGGVCQNPATSAVAVTAATGAYSFPAVAAGSYCLIVTNNSTLSNTTAYLPPGWIGIEAPAGVRQITTSASPSPVQNFGLFNGSSLALTVFADTGIGGGSANDGVQNGGEAGINGVVVTASMSGGAVTSSTTANSGTATLWFPAALSGTLTLTPTAPGGDLATGGSAGTTGGSYARPSVTFTLSAGNTYSGITFGLIPPNALAPTGTQTAQPGTTVYYPHTFIAGSAGQVTFSTTAVASPSGLWEQSLYLDSACSAQIAGSDTLISSAMTVVAGQTICILVSQLVSRSQPNAKNIVTVQAAMVYSGSAAPANNVLTVTDTTTVVTTGATAFIKQVQNLTLAGPYGTSNTALPGNTLQYQLTVTNQGSAALATVIVNDSTAAYTNFVSAACPTPLPTGITSCSVTTQPAAGAQGALQWTFGGSLAPGSQVVVTYQVLVTQ